MFTPNDLSSFIYVVQNEYPENGWGFGLRAEDKKKELNSLKDKVYTVLIGYAEHNLTEFAEAEGIDSFAQKMVKILEKNKLLKLKNDDCYALSEGQSTVYYMLSTPGFFIKLDPNILSISEAYDKKLSALVRAKCVLFLFENNDQLKEPIPNEWFDAQEVHIRQGIGSDEDWVKYNILLSQAKNKKQVADLLPEQVAAAAAQAPLHFQHQVDEIDPYIHFDNQDSFLNKNDFSIFRMLSRSKSPERNIFYTGPRTFLEVLRILALGMVMHPRLMSYYKNIFKGIKNFKNYATVLKGQISHTPRNKVQLLLLMKTLKNAWMSAFDTTLSVLAYAFGFLVALTGVLFPPSLALIVLDSLFNEFKIPGRRFVSFIVNCLESIREIFVANLILRMISPFVQLLSASNLTPVVWFVRGSFLVTSASSLAFVLPLLTTIGVIFLQNPNLAEYGLALVDYLANSTTFAVISIVTGSVFALQSAYFSVLGAMILTNKAYQSVNAWLFGNDNALQAEPEPAPELSIPQFEFIAKQPQIVGGLLTRLSQDFDNIPEESLIRLVDDAHPLGELKQECIDFRGRALNNNQTIFNEPRVNQFVALYHEHQAKNVIGSLKFF